MRGASRHRSPGRSSCPPVPPPMLPRARFRTTLRLPLLRRLLNSLTAARDDADYIQWYPTPFRKAPPNLPLGFNTWTFGDSFLFYCLKRSGWPCITRSSLKARYHHGRTTTGNAVIPPPGVNDDRVIHTMRRNQAKFSSGPKSQQFPEEAQ